jgi:5'-nucleotidase (lipoprotein e(P4) family)
VINKFVAARLVSLLYGLTLSFSLPAQVLAVPSTEISQLAESDNGSRPPLKDGLKFSYSKEAIRGYLNAKAAGIKAIDKALAENKGDGSKLCVISDIDETLLDNRPFMEREVTAHDDKVNWEQFESWINESGGKLISPTSELLAYARKKGLAVFLISGRVEKLRHPTITNLIKYGIAFDGLYLRPDGDSSAASSMKSAYRKQIEDMGYKIVVNIGDQYSDLAGGYSIDCEKLPNQMYFIK